MRDREVQGVGFRRISEFGYELISATAFSSPAESSTIRTQNIQIEICLAPNGLRLVALLGRY